MSLRLQWADGREMTKDEQAEIAERTPLNELIPKTKELEQDRERTPTLGR